MSKKMKRGALESSPYVVYEDTKARLKHQTLFQDFQELHKETNDTRDKLEDMKMRKQRLLAEVHFLRRRREYLLQMKSSSHPQQQERAALPNSDFYSKKGMKDRFASKKEAKQHKLPPLPRQSNKAARIQFATEASCQKTHPDILVNHKQALHIGKDAVLRSTVPSLKHKSRVYSGKEVLLRKAAPVFDLNQNGRPFAGNSSISRSTNFDLNQETGHGGKDVVLPSRAPVIDLNEISITEEEPQANFEPLNFEDAKRGGLIQNTNDDQHRDLKLSICRNVGEGTSRVEKRKISWQDPVALRV